MSPIVSVVIPAYNAAAFIERSIASIQRQTLQDLEILVIDDASQDDTIAMVRAMMETDARIQLFEQANNGGPAVARNTCISNARGRYIAFLDADDAFLPDRLQCLVTLAETDQLDLVTDNQVLHDAHLGRDVDTLEFNQTGAAQPLTALQFLKGSNNIPTLREIVSGNRAAHFPLIKPLIRSTFLRTHGILYNPSYRIGEDFDLLIRCLLEGAKAAIAPHALYVYTMPYSDISGTHSGQSRTRFTMQPVMDNVDHLIGMYATRLSPEVRKELTRCKSGSHGLEQFEQFKTDLQDQRASALMRLIKHPMILQYAARSTTTKLRSFSTRLMA